MIWNPDSDSGKSNAPQIDKFIGEKQFTAFSEIPGCTFERGINKLSQLASPIGYNTVPVRTRTPENCEIFAQRYQSQPITPKFQNTANIYLTFRNHVKIFLSRNIMHNFKAFFTTKI